MPAARSSDDGSRFLRTQSWEVSGLNSARAAENIGAGYFSTEEAFTGWRQSPGHNANLLTIVEMWIPIGLGVIGLILVGLAFTGRWRREPAAAKPTRPGPQKIGV